MWLRINIKFVKGRQRSTVLVSRPCVTFLSYVLFSRLTVATEKNNNLFHKININIINNTYFNFCTFVKNYNYKGKELYLAVLGRLFEKALYVNFNNCCGPHSILIK